MSVLIEVAHRWQEVEHKVRLTQCNRMLQYYIKMCGTCFAGLISLVIHLIVNANGLKVERNWFQPLTDQ
jgi:hypothetical protein